MSFMLRNVLLSFLESMTEISQFVLDLFRFEVILESKPMWENFISCGFQRFD